VKTGEKMNTFLIITMIIFVIAIAAAKIKKTSIIKKIQLPYSRKKTLLNEKEQILFHRLIESMPEHFVMAQVRLADIVEVKKGTTNWRGWQNKIDRKSIDFVICDKSLAVMACIELDGKTHEQENRQKTDGDKDETLEAAGIPIIRIQASKLPSSEIIRKYLEDKILQPKPPSVDS
jgi:hypothetical protein